MSQKNVEIVGGMLDRTRTEPEVMYEMLADDVEWDASVFGALEYATCRGSDGVRQFFRRWVGAFADYGYEVEDLIDGGDTVLALIHQWGRGKGSGVAVDQRFWQAWTLLDGKVIRVTHHVDKEEAVRAVGLAE